MDKKNLEVLTTEAKAFNEYMNFPKLTGSKEERGLAEVARKRRSEGGGTEELSNLLKSYGLSCRSVYRGQLEGFAAIELSPIFANKTEGRVVITDGRKEVARRRKVRRYPEEIWGYQVWGNRFEAFGDEGLSDKPSLQRRVGIQEVWEDSLVIRNATVVITANAEEGRVTRIISVDIPNTHPKTLVTLRGLLDRLA